MKRHCPGTWRCRTRSRNPEGCQFRCGGRLLNPGKLCQVLLLLLLLLLLPASAVAHIGSLTAIYEGVAGSVPVRVIVRPPGVVPGLADVDVRVLTNGVNRVTVLPVYWRAGTQGAPPPDVCSPVEGDPNLYHARLWLMERGAYSVHVNVETVRGSGSVIVPVNSLATARLPMPTALGVGLCALGGLLFVLAVSVIGAAVGESVLDPGLGPTRRRRWIGRGAIALSALFLALAVGAGRVWWNRVDLEHRNNHLYKPVQASANVRVEEGQRIAQLTIVPTGSKSVGWTPLVPDHGKLMHLFLVREPAMDVLAHLHPIRRSPTVFEAVLPPLPEGNYAFYGDVTHENGFSRTVTAVATIPPPASTARAIDPSLVSDADDSWHRSEEKVRSLSAPGKAVCVLGDGLTMQWDPSAPFMASRETSLRFLVLDGNGQAARLEPYMGMLSHAILRRDDGGVFAHLHPAGSISVASQQVFQLRAGQKPVGRITPELMEKLCRLPEGEIVQQPISFPYEFPRPGRYRLWIQVKSNDRVYTGVFDADVPESK